jgi:DNA repair ATPase RecN
MKSTIQSLQEENHRLQSSQHQDTSQVQKLEDKIRIDSHRLEELNDKLRMMNQTHEEYQVMHQQLMNENLEVKGRLRLLQKDYESKSHQYHELEKKIQDYEEKYQQLAQDKKALEAEFLQQVGYYLLPSCCFVLIAEYMLLIDGRTETTT